jgi:hypothetical protein
MARKNEGTTAVRNSASEVAVQITPPNFTVAEFRIVGLAPLVMHKFSQKSRETIRANQEMGHRAKKGKKHEPKDFDAQYRGAFHLSREGWCGIPAAAFRMAMISACRLVAFAMTLGKISLFIEPDGYDADDGTPLVRITDGQPKRVEHHVRVGRGGVEVRVRPMWEKWGAVLRVRFDADAFSVADIANLIARAGTQVGVCEGRPDSKDSAGMGWGLFAIAESK